MNGNIMKDTIMNRDMKKIRRIMLITAATIMVVVVLTLSVLNALVYRRQVLVTVDAAVLVAKQAEQLAARYPKSKVTTHELQQIADQLKESVARIAKENNLVILAKGAVWGGDLPDYTDMILKLITVQQSNPTEH